MTAQDNVSSLFTAIRNGVTLRKLYVSHIYSNYLSRILDVLLQTGYIGGYRLYTSGKFLKVRIFLKYTESGDSVLQEIVSVSKPGQRTFLKLRDLKTYKNFCGLYILSTTQGVCTDFAARKNKVGGEILCKIF